jgi:hypothetical protein
MLAACTTRKGQLARRLRQLAGVQVAQEGNDGVNVVFHVRDFAAVAEIMKPRRRRRLSEKRKKALEALGADFRFGAKHGAGARKTTSESPVTVSDGPGASKSPPAKTQQSLWAG